METIPLFTSINYERAKSYTQGLFLTLGYLGRNQITVLKDSEIQLVKAGKLSWHDTALKVAAFAFLLSVALVAINACYRIYRQYRHKFIMVRAVQPPSPPSTQSPSLHPAPSENPQPVERAPIQPIAINFTLNKSIAEQREAHKIAKEYLKEELTKIGAEVCFVSASHGPLTKVDKVEIHQDLDETVFTWEPTLGVQDAIQKDGKLDERIVLYGVASQFNGCEAASRFTPPPGTAVDLYLKDPTQGPAAQLQFSNEQVEIINNGANLGFNGLCQVLDDNTKIAIQDGYLTPTNELAQSVIEQLEKNGDKIEFACIGNIPKGNNTQKVYQMLVAAPAFGLYSISPQATDAEKKEIEFLCALYAYRAQFQQAIQLATSSSTKQVIFKPTSPGLGVFGNRLENIAKAFYVAAKEYENQLKEKKIQVRFQVFNNKKQVFNSTTSESQKMSNILGLRTCTKTSIG